MPVLQKPASPSARGGDGFTGVQTECKLQEPAQIVL